MTKRYYTVTTVTARGTKTERLEMSPEMARIADRAAELWEKHGCSCRRPHPDHVALNQRGHSVDVSCTDCGGLRQVG